MRSLTLALIVLPALGLSVPGQETGDKEWSLLLEYIELALPKTTGKGISDESRAKLDLRKIYLDDDAKEAARLEVRPIPGLEEKLAGFVKSHLLRLQLTGVSAVEVDDFSQFLKTLATVPEGLSSTEKLTLDAVKAGKETLAKRGWLVEVRGFTFHHKGADFVRDTLVENLAAGENVNVLSAEMREAIAERVGFVIVYQTHKAKEESLGGSPVLSKSPLKALVEGGKLGKGRGVVDRLSIKVDEPRRAKGEAPTIRTDFSVLFFWRAAEPPEKKK